MVDKTNVDLLSYSTFFDGNRFNRNKVKESWVKSHYSIEYSNIEIFCRYNRIETNIFSQKLYHYIFSLNHIPICIKCNLKFRRYEGFNKGYNLFCSKGCASSNSFKKGYETRVQNTMKKYGVSHTTQLESVKEKMKISNMLNLGVEYAAQHPDILNRMKKTNMERYGVEFPMQNENIYKKTLERMNISNISNLPEVKSKIKENSLKKWGCAWPIQSLEVKEKIKRSLNTSISLKIEDLYKNSNEIKFISYFKSFI